MLSDKLELLSHRLLDLLLPVLHVTVMSQICNFFFHSFSFSPLSALRFFTSFLLSTSPGAHSKMNRFIKIIHLFSFPYIYTNLLGIMILESYPIFPSMSIGFLYFLKRDVPFACRQAQSSRTDSTQDTGKKLSQNRESLCVKFFFLGLKMSLQSSTTVLDDVHLCQI